MYSIVIFEDNSCEGVPSSWVFKAGENTYCFWPDVPRGKMGNYIKNYTLRQHHGNQMFAQLSQLLIHMVKW